MIYCTKCHAKFEDLFGLKLTLKLFSCKYCDSFWDAFKKYKYEPKKS